MRKELLIICLLLQAMIAFSQYKIRGYVTDSAGVSVDAAVVALMRVDNSVPIQQGITTPEGKYELTASGKVCLYVSCLGYRSYVSESFEVRKDTLMPVIRLLSENFMLDNVVVIGEKQSPSIRIERGKMVFTPKNSGVMAGNSAIELLKKTPGVFVDGENNISLGGKGGVSVILNGRRTYMQKEELISLLRSTPASAVSSVEVIQNPSVSYDAEGSGGVININMDKRRAEGFSCLLNNGFSYWNHLRENTELSVGYTNGRLSLLGNYNHTFGYFGMDYGMRREQGGKIYESPTYDTDKRKTISGNLSLEYRLKDHHLVGGRLDVNTLFGPGETSTITEIKEEESGVLEQTLYAKNDYFKQKGNRYGGNLYYVATPSEDVSYTLDFNYAWFDGGSSNWQPNTYKSPSGDILDENLYKSFNRRNIHIYALSYDQRHPLWGGELRSGLKYSSVDADNGYRFYNVKDRGDEQVDVSQSNDFRYKEHLLATYLMYVRSFGNQLSLELGLRGEYTFSDGLLHPVDGQEERNKRNYLDIFPSLNVNYQIDERQALVLGYSSRIDRPAYQDLNPFEYLLDELSYWKGNPFLSPQKTHQVSLVYNYKRTSLSAIYSYMKDYKAQITDTLSVDKVIMTPRNIGKQQRFSLTLYQGINIVRCWEMNLNLVGYYVKNDISFDQYRLFNLDGFAGIFSIQNTIILPWSIQMELNGSFSTKHLGASNEYVKPSGYVDLGLTKSFANKRWTVNVAMSDLFWTSCWDNYSSFSGFRLWNWGKGESRQIKVNITYRFGKSKENSHNGALEELNRL